MLTVRESVADIKNLSKALTAQIECAVGILFCTLLGINILREQANANDKY
jgi:hypothetical protein